MAACTPNGTCQEGKDLGGVKIPVKVTVDFENSIVGAVDEDGYARTDKFDGVAESAEQQTPRSRRWPSVCVTVA
jgi:hypothetical protein